MDRSGISGLGLVLALACLGGDVLADAAGDYQSLFGKRARTAAATRSTKDDAELAAAMVEAAGSLGDRRDLQVLLYEKAADFGSRDPAGCEVATRALGKLMGLVPARQAEWRDKLLDVYQFRYKRSGRSERAEAGELLVEQFLVVADAALADGDAAKANSLYRRALPVAAAVKSPRRKEISDRIKAATARLAVQRRRRGLEFRLKANPDDPRLREALIRLHVLDRDDPRTAAELVTANVDEVLRTCVPLAAKPLENLPGAACLELARWYESLGTSAAALARLTAMRRAGACYQRYLAVHPEEDLSRLKAELALKEIEKKLAAIGATLGEQWVVDLGKGVVMRLMRIPAGSFLMGSPKGDKPAQPAEGPRHKVTITKPFYLGVTEVTQEQYTALVGRNPSRSPGPKNPVTNISWDDAVAFCSRLAAKARRPARLPTEAEWEYACRAGTNTRFCFGDSQARLDEYACHRGNSGGKPLPAGRKKPNAWGLHDMHGNVLEWCSDWYGEKYYDKPDPVDPAGPVSGSRRVLRGGAWNRPADTCRSACRYGLPGNYRVGYIGFRVVITSSAGPD